MVRANGSARPSPSVTPGPGAATPAFGPAGTPLPGSAAAGLQPVVGINFGNSYASIAVLTSEGLSECIANEDGERQIACALSYHGDETYIGNQAIPQLVKNSKNTIIGFRDLLGKKFSEISKSEQPTRSAPVIQHPTQPDVPAYSVQASADADAEPRIISVSEAATMFLASLLQSAQDFLGAPASGAVLTYPPSFTPAQKQALKAAAEAAGITVLQLLDEAGAVAVATSEVPSSAPSDRVQLQIDLGASSLALQLIQIRDGLAVLLDHSISNTISTDGIDKALIEFFAKDFTKKNKIALDLPTGDKRAQTLFELNLPFTKRTLSASAKTAASISIESLKDGYDYTGSINRMRFSMLAKPVFNSIADAVSDLLASVKIDARQVDEVVLVGGGGCLPGLLEHLSTKLGLGTEDEPVHSPEIDPTEILSRGCASQAGLLHGLSVEEDADIRAVFEKDEDVVEVDAISKTIGIALSPALPNGDAPKDGDAIIPVLWVDTPIPARRSYTFEPAHGSDGKITIEVVEAEEYIYTEKVKLPKLENDDGEEEEEEDEEEEVKHRSWKKSGSLGKVELTAKTKSKVTVEITVTKDGALSVSVQEDGEGGASAQL